MSESKDSSATRSATRVRRWAFAPLRAIGRRVSTVHESVRAVWAALVALGRIKLVRATMALVVIPMTVLVGLSGAAMHWTSQPSFCAKCHPMEPFIQGWKENPHRDVNCEQCHLPPGTIGFIGGKISSLQVVVDYARGDYRDESFNAVVSNASCLKCHADIENRTVVKDNVKVDHRNIIRLGSKCMTCHSTVGHGDATPIGARTYPTMNTCFSCHDDRTAPTTCSVCHLPGDWRLPPADAAGKPKAGK